MTKIKQQYNKEVVPNMKKKFGFKNDLEVPRIEKVVINSGVGRFIKDANLVKEIFDSIQSIVGQKPVMTKAKTSIVGFKTREGLEIGIKATLRGKRMWDFLDRLINSAIPRVRDFQGINQSSIDASGNLNIGIKEHMIFPEIIAENVKSVFSLQVIVVTTAKSREEGKELFKLLKLPIKE
ncbi:MAG: 50S ribosomal protein L5 [Candidatus Moranbacteria bacterium CG10_big_fil_rev_8_21_14_0_10_35_21]|nr:MAG: 50S ribosomal protein L5 [Candidatus Moranbacteria bacterium CG10_big_fil_rev_8_21_14_0_10_35_21]PJA88780.1 MAG: 50S ribosomal protein L5 [Candidatus Moranbacteria bacterium CG_4_9_14_3_um_filter_36_9]